MEEIGYGETFSPIARIKILIMVMTLGSVEN
jgi:hypothetical protein